MIRAHERRGYTSMQSFVARARPGVPKTRTHAAQTQAPVSWPWPCSARGLPHPCATKVQTQHRSWPGSRPSDRRFTTRPACSTRAGRSKYKNARPGCFALRGSARLTLIRCRPR